MHPTCMSLICRALSLERRLLGSLFSHLFPYLQSGIKVRKRASGFYINYTQRRWVRPGAFSIGTRGYVNRGDFESAR